MWDLDPSTNVMVDIETAASSKRSAVLSIGACTFDEKSSFYVNVDLKSCIAAGLDVDGNTFYWWLSQSDEAREALMKDRMHLKDALKTFSSWLTQTVSGGKWQSQDLYMWSHGSDFDLAVLASAYDAVDVRTPWLFRNTRDTRTMFHLFPQEKWQRAGVLHNALDDAITQTRAVVNAHSDYRRLHAAW